VLFEGRRAVGVEFDREGKTETVHAARAVILSAGAVKSPQLLELSGVGAPELLRAQGIALRHALPGVGENLRDHYAPRFVARVKDIDTINELARGTRLAGQIAKWLFTRKGILALSPTLVYCFWHSNEATRTSDLQLTFTPASYLEGVQGQLEREPGMTVACWQQRPESSGYVRAQSADPFEAPVIQPNYLAEDFPGPHVQSDDELMGAARERGTTTFHPAGTCRMGPVTEDKSVVDDQLRVHGLEGLRIVDASIMPTMLSANLNAATLMIAEKASDIILGSPAAEPIVLPGDEPVK